MSAKACGKLSFQKSCMFIGIINFGLYHVEPISDAKLLWLKCSVCCLVHSTGVGEPVELVGIPGQKCHQMLSTSDLR